MAQILSENIKYNLVHEITLFFCRSGVIVDSPKDIDYRSDNDYQIMNKIKLTVLMT